MPACRVINTIRRETTRAISVSGFIASWTVTVSEYGHGCQNASCPCAIVGW